MCKPIDAVHKCVWDSYSRWRAEIDQRAACVYDAASAEPSLAASGVVFGIGAWWSDMVHKKLRNDDVAKKRHHTNASALPHDVSVLPPERASTQWQGLGDVEGPAGAGEAVVERDGDEGARCFVYPFCTVKHFKIPAIFSGPTAMIFA